MPDPIDVYPVGVLADLLMLRRALAARHRQAILHALRRLRYTARHIADRARRGERRTVRNMFNGYLAEPTPFPPGMTRCGSGWTRRRALRSLDRQFAVAADRLATALTIPTTTEDTDD